MKQIAYHHVDLRASVLDVIDMFIRFKQEMESLEIIDIQRMFLDTMMYLLDLGFVVPTLRKLQELVPTLDLALIRHAFVKVLEIVDVPLSAECAHLLIDIICNLRTKDALKSLHVSQKKDLSMLAGTFLKNSSHFLTEHFLKAHPALLTQASKDTLQTYVQ